MKKPYEKFAILAALTLLIAGGALLSSCASRPKEGPLQVKPDYSQDPVNPAHAIDTELAEGLSPLYPAEAPQSNSFALDMYKALSEDGKNIFFSPASIYTAFSMVYEGALENSEAEIRQVFSFNRDKDLQHQSVQTLTASLEALVARGKADISISNAMFCDDEQVSRLSESFKDKLAKYYNSELFLVDYSMKREAANTINAWVEEKTKERIKNLVSEDNFDDETALSVLNAIYFKANWLHQFNSGNTREDKFYPDITNRNEWVPVQLMSQNNRLPYAEFRGFKMLELPYEEDDLSMVIILPQNMESLESQLNPESLEYWLSSLTPREVVAFLPKFELTHTVDKLADTLKAMGLRTSFERWEANLRGIFHVGSDENVYIQDVLHKAFIEVNEEGSEAAAATAVIIGITKSAATDPVVPQVFRADHPFIYMIRHKPSGNILFMGKFAEVQREA